MAPQAKMLTFLHSFSIDFALEIAISMPYIAKKIACGAYKSSTIYLKCSELVSSVADSSDLLVVVSKTMKMVPQST